MPACLWDDSSDEFYMRLALLEALCSYSAGEIPVGPVAVFDGELLAAAHNLRETLRDPTAHAEMIVLRRAAEAVGG